MRDNEREAGLVGAGARGREHRPFPPERVDAVRRRILEGAYDSPRVAEETARRLLRSGDL